MMSSTTATATAAAEATSAGHTQSGLYTCVTCHVAFKDQENQRSHFQTEWHQYNLKRKIAAMKPVTKAEFEAKMEAQQQKSQEEEAKATFTASCQVCNKHYSSENAYNNHLLSKKHKENELRAPGKKEKPVKEKPAQPEEQEEPEDEGTSNDEELTDDQLLEKKIANARRLTPEECLFCGHFSESFDQNMQHMTTTHSFFIPDIEYLVDLDGLIQYLGEKISIGNVCLYCNGKGKGFNTMGAVQKHMIDKGHCKLDYDDDADLEYSDYYDFRPSYPDYQEGQGDKEADEEMADADVRAPIISEGEVELVLPNGKVLGHRSLNKYYKQKFKPEDTRTSVAVSKLMGQYRALGWNTAPKERSHEQIEQLRNRQAYMMNIGVSANRLQKHFRPQVDF